MAEILSIIWNELFGLTVPVIGITYKQFVLGMFIVFVLISIVRHKIKGGDE